MMTLEEIRAANINPAIAREAYDQSAKRLSDTLDTKKAFEQKAFTLFGGYLTIALALFGAGAAVFKNTELQSLVLPFWVTGLIVVGGAICFLLALQDKSYGAIGSHPAMWLNSGTIDGPDTALPTMLAYITYHHGERIDTSEAMNYGKARNIKLGIYAGIGAPVIFMILVTVFKQ